ncbi:tannase and feruloyl esterase [Aureobasidium pullulans]|uniref:Carboxylic ester hydrolase n=1 Tax=Aureobasidium pullulans TaxID=5580 RepID=A0A4S9Y3G7_AURPU|nr:tannase and feruloyl esterase [Aureobasidium pullulans]
MHLSSTVFSSQTRTTMLSQTLGLAVLALPLLAEAKDCSQAAFQKIIPSNSTFNYVTKVAAGGTFTDAYANANATGLPEGCAVSVRVPTPGNSSYNMAIYLPNKWNSRIMTTGNGGYAGFTNWQDLGIYSQYGFAALTTDTGHDNANPLDSTFALNKGSLENWGWRAMHGSVLVGKALSAAYYGENHKYSYYSGCSTGGRQGLKEMQVSPEAFDGLFVGAPAWWIPHLGIYTSQATLGNLPQNSSRHISAALATVINDEILKQCDPQDGVTDKVIMNPEGCVFNPLTLLCESSSNTSACITRPQLDTLYKALHDWTYFDGTLIFPAPSLGTPLTAYIGDSPLPNPMGTGMIQHLLLNTTEPYDWSTFNESVVRLSEAIDPGNASPDDYDLSTFQKRGGKVIHWHGTSDPIIPYRSSTYFYSQVASSVAPHGIEMDDFYRFFPIAGMSHCSGSQYSPWYIGGASQPLTNVSHGVPGFDDSQHNGLLALMRWVENGTAPERLIATKYNEDNPAKGVYRQRPLCPFPKQPVYTHGKIDSASSWKCV